MPPREKQVGCKYSGIHILRLRCISSHCGEDIQQWFYQLSGHWQSVKSVFVYNHEYYDIAMFGKCPSFLNTINS